MTKKMIIEGMMCGHCEAHVKKALEAIPGVESATRVLYDKENPRTEVIITSMEENNKLSDKEKQNLIKLLKNKHGYSDEDIEQIMNTESSDEECDWM